MGCFQCELMCDQVNFIWYTADLFGNVLFLFNVVLFGKITCHCGLV